VSADLKYMVEIKDIRSGRAGDTEVLKASNSGKSQGDAERQKEEEASRVMA